MHTAGRLTLMGKIFAREPLARKAGISASRCWRQWTVSVVEITLPNMIGVNPPSFFRCLKVKEEEAWGGAGAIEVTQ